PNTRAARARFLEALDFAHADVGGELLAFRDGTFGVGCSAFERALDRAGGDLLELIHAAVPPTVMRSIFTVGMPTPTGTLWPSLPHTPMPSSRRRSFPTMLTYFRASGPFPISVALRTGRVSRPSSMR